MEEVEMRFQMGEDAEQGDIVELADGALYVVEPAGHASEMPPEEDCEGCMEDVPPAVGITYTETSGAPFQVHLKSPIGKYWARIEERVAGVVLWRRRAAKEDLPVKLIPWSQVIEVLYE